MVQVSPTSDFEKLTAEQQQIVMHPDNHHGRVLAVAGSGKTTTMAHRIRHLMKERGIGKHQIQVLMFNHLARNQFIEKLDKFGISRSQQPSVNTFHSFAYRVGNLAGQVQWFGENEGLGTLNLLKAISKVAKLQKINRAELSLDEAERAIGLWKGSLIPPNYAGYTGSNGNAYVAIYREFEDLRHENNAITFDDFVPLAVALIQGDRSKLSQHASALKYIIVDEYQDINLGQEKLIELLASYGADVMVVGDDDQTIYEWRGARSEYILREFMTTFSSKPHLTYHLTNSFRFGYSIAQASNNVISHNTNRLEKTLIAYNPQMNSRITLVHSVEVNRRLTNEVINLVKHKKVAPSDIRILGRTYAQFNSVMIEFMLRKIPFKVEGGAPFIKSSECNVLLDYLRVASSIDLIPGRTLEPRFLNIANKPNRYLGHAALRLMLQNGQNDGKSLRKLLRETTKDPGSFSSNSQRENLNELLSLLEELGSKIGKIQFPLQEICWIG